MRRGPTQFSGEFCLGPQYQHPGSRGSQENEHVRISVLKGRGSGGGGVPSSYRLPPGGGASGAKQRQPPLQCKPASGSELLTKFISS